MKVVTINVPDQYLDCLEVMVNMGIFPSRSEAVREALKQFLTREAVFNEGVVKQKFHALKQAQMNALIR